ncbi:MAG: methionyl-tRNA formyltransferase [Candidatus Omnitrophota bacterium]
MNIIFFGSSEFAVKPLEALIKRGYNICCVVTQPDRKKGRHLHLEGTAVKQLAREHQLKVLQPVNINSPEALLFLRKLEADLFVVISYGQILSGQVLLAPKLFAVNAHASLLPKYRGAAPINWAIIRGEKTSGISIIKMTEKMDAGPIIAQKSLNIEDGDDASSLEEKLSALAADMIVACIESIKNNSYKLTPQPTQGISLAPKLRKNDGLIDWDKTAQEINNLVRACVKWPGAFTHYKGKLLKIYKAQVTKPQSHKTTSKPGEIIWISKEEIVVATQEGALRILELQPEGKRRMLTAEFISGHKISSGENFSKT